MPGIIPQRWALAAHLSRSCLALARGDLHRLDDLRIGGAAAEVAGQIVADLIVVRIRIAFEQLRGHQNKARGAVAALEGAGLDKGLLHRAQRIAIGERLHRVHFGAVDERCEIEAAGDGGAVDQYGAAAAHALAAALARAHQIELALQDLDEIVMRLDLGCDRLAVEGKADGAGHGSYSSPSGLLSLARSARNTVSGFS